MKAKLFSTVMMVSAILLLSACASTEESRKLELEEAVICCSSYADMDFEELTFGMHSLKFGPNSNVKEFVGKRSFFKAYQLPELEGKYLKIKTYISGDGLLGSRYFLPVFIALDEHHKPIKALTVRMHIEQSLLSYYAAGWFPLKMLDGAKYLVIMTGDVDNENFRKNLAEEFSYQNNQVPAETKRATQGKVDIELRKASDDEVPYWHKVDRIINGWLG
ncbi:hypothetical protein ACRRS0_11095 [Agarivorans sp. QJM3NY_29]|uniref:hypothetical protein n=1 Tax=unclassified Agarivorans TaxID=2636026 RepID=UPI003D7DBF1D